jgi:hypothetical protein
MRALTTKPLRKFLEASNPKASKSEIKSRLRLLKHKYNKIPRNERFNFKEALRKAF